MGAVVKGMGVKRRVNWRVVGIVAGLLVLICVCVVVTDYVAVRDRHDRSEATTGTRPGT